MLWGRLWIVYIPFGMVKFKFLTQLPVVLYHFTQLLLSLLLLIIAVRVSRTLLSILADFNNELVLMVSAHSVISMSSCPCTNNFETVLRAPTTISITNTFRFHSFFQFPSKVHILILLFSFSQFYSVVSRNNKFYNSDCSPFLYLFFYSFRVFHLSVS